jgi:hypothetical protein
MARMFLAGKSPYPIERTLLTTGLTAAGVDSLYAGQQRSKTPHLAIQYQPNPTSKFCTSLVSFDLSQQLSRRTLLGTAAALPLLGKQELKRIAMITTVYRYFRTASTWVIASWWLIRTMARGICRAKIVSVGQKLGRNRPTVGLGEEASRIRN